MTVPAPTVPGTLGAMLAETIVDIRAAGCCSVAGPLATRAQRSVTGTFRSLKLPIAPARLSW